MSNSLAGITNQSIRSTMGNRSFAAATLAIDVVTTDVQTTVAVPHTIGGQWQTPLATKAAIDLSAATIVDGKDGAVVSAVKTKPAVAATDSAVTTVYIMACAGDNVFVVEPSVDIAAISGTADYSLSCPDQYAPFGAIKIVQAAGAAAFTLGTTALTGVTGQTVTFHDLSVCPATAADLT